MSRLLASEGYDCPIPTNDEWERFGSSFLPVIRVGYVTNRRPQKVLVSFAHKHLDITEELRRDLENARDLMALMAEECDRAIERLEAAAFGLGGVQ